MSDTTLVHLKSLGGFLYPDASRNILKQLNLAKWKLSTEMKWKNNKKVSMIWNKQLEMLW